jgi:hypothetical protein
VGEFETAHHGEIEDRLLQELEGGGQIQPGLGQQLQIGGGAGQGGDREMGVDQAAQPAALAQAQGAG